MVVFFFLPICISKLKFSLQLLPAQIQLLTETGVNKCLQSSCCLPGIPPGTLFSALFPVLET